MKRHFTGLYCVLLVTLALGTSGAASMVMANPEISVSYTHRIIPDGFTPNPEVVALEGGVWAMFNSDQPVAPAGRIRPCT